MKLGIKKKETGLLFLMLLTLAETASCTYLLESSVNSLVAALIYFISGLSIGLFPLLDKSSISSLSPNKKFNINTNKWLLPAGFVLIGMYFVVNAVQIFNTMTIDVVAADMLPQIQAMCDRLISGEQVYAPIEEIWNGKQPPYMPLMWLPFTLAHWSGIDIRWTTIVFILLGLYCTFRILPKKFSGNPVFVLSAFCSLFLLFHFLLIKDKITLGRTEEGIVIGYYLFLAYTLTRKQPILIGVAIACCLMSRFSLFFWVPMYLIYVFFYESRKQAYIVAATIGIVVFFVFLLPYGFWQPEYFLNIPADYHVGVDNAWRSNEVNGKYYQNDLGYARFFDISQIKLLHDLQIIVAALLPFLLLGLYKFLRNRIDINGEFFGICTLKIVLVFFYNMVEVPYYYLFFTSAFFSYSVLFAYMRKLYSTTE